MAQFVKVATVSEVPVGSVCQVTAAGKLIALANVGGRFYAIDNVCTHRGGPLGQGILQDDNVVCPWHAWEWNVKTGECSFNPSEKLPTYEVKVEGDDILVAVG